MQRSPRMGSGRGWAAVAQRAAERDLLRSFDQRDDLFASEIDR
jgi:hypothetical protein